MIECGSDGKKMRLTYSLICRWTIRKYKIRIVVRKSDVNNYQIGSIYWTSYLYHRNWWSAWSPERLHGSSADIETAKSIVTSASLGWYCRRWCGDSIYVIGWCETSNRPHLFLIHLTASTSLEQTSKQDHDIQL